MSGQPTIIQDAMIVAPYGAQIEIKAGNNICGVQQHLINWIPPETIFAVELLVDESPVARSLPGRYSSRDGKWHFRFVPKVPSQGQLFGLRYVYYAEGTWRVTTFHGVNCQCEECQSSGRWSG